MPDDAPAMRPADPATRLAVEDVIKRFGLGIDLRDWDMFEACLDDRVLMDLDPRVGETPDLKLPRKAIVANAKGEFEKYDETLHLYSVASVVFDADGAAVRTNFVAHHYRADEPGDRTFVQHGMYLHRLREAGDGRWVITEWHQDVRFSVGNRALMDRD
ncbi:nuclear transport factor 2 family protein [Jannaschia sp. Os4]|uniref:nuclear transport factor 2 family protein n=1 Tax=Jannaschia sp. Os4 TaxID=2807617 RepID=UPI001939CECF|nr:nuclear transport factor 2 family protein [Jannaschia sp. Os4]MBM2577971.1 nuclear transport factor 2 family protein [Jannaschia sp. Os4]